MVDQPPVRKRFIAGALCPQCQQIDTLQMWEEAGVPHRACVRCGHQLAMIAESLTPVCPAGRLEQRAAPQIEGQPLIFFPKPPARNDD
ncbi:MAG: YheV family putative metal-binding protein [Pseudomonadales bacterium]|nr:YheV family putative metal-binding protein [Pseudomonadales bacterium]